MEEGAELGLGTLNGETVHRTESPSQKSLQLTKNGDGWVAGKSHSWIEPRLGGGPRRGELVWPLNVHVLPWASDPMAAHGGKISFIFKSSPLGDGDIEPQK